MKQNKSSIWVTYKFGDLFSVKHGYGFDGEYFTNSGSYILLTPGNFFDEGGFKYKGDKEKYYVGKIPNGFILKEGDLIVAMTEQMDGLLGSSAIVPKSDKYLHNQRLGLIVDLRHELLNKKFLYYLFNTSGVRNQIKASASGTKVRHTSPSRIYEVKVTIPSEPIQHHIADILSAYDDLIENNTRRIRILEQMAQSVYREWIGKVDVQSLPEGWEIRPFSELVDIDPATPVDKQIEKPFVGMNALSESSMIINLNLVETRTGNSGAKFQNRDVLFPRITPSVENGKGAFVQFLEAGQVSIGSTEIIVFREKEINAEFIYFLSREHEFRGNAINSMVGASGRQRVQQRCFDTFMVAKPPKDLQQKFADIVSPMFRITHTLTLKNANLRRTSALLLPRLVSGEIDVGEVAGQSIS